MYREMSQVLLNELISGFTTNSGVLIRGALAVGVTVTDVGGSFIFFFLEQNT